MSQFTERIGRVVASIPGWFDQANIDGFAKLDLPPEPIILECGTYCGRSAQVMRFLWPDAEIHSCDPADQPERVIGDYMFYCSRGADLEWSEPIDMLFIDDSHLYDDIKANFTRFLPFVTPGGLIVFHDYHKEPISGAEGVTQFVNELGSCELDTNGEFGLAIYRKPI